MSAQVKACDLFVLLWSRHSEGSTYVQSEVFLAKSEGKRILRVLLQQGVKLPTMLGDLKYLPLNRDPQATLAELKTLVTASAGQKATNNLIGIARMAFSGRALWKAGD